MNNNIAHSKNLSTAISTKRRKKKTELILLSISEGGILRSWLTIRIPGWIGLLVCVAFLLVTIAIIISPDIAAQFALLIIQLTNQSLKGAK